MVRMTASAKEDSDDERRNQSTPGDSDRQMTLLIPFGRPPGELTVVIETVNESIEHF